MLLSVLIKCEKCFYNSLSVCHTLKRNFWYKNIRGIRFVQKGNIIQDRMILELWCDEIGFDGGSVWANCLQNISFIYLLTLIFLSLKILNVTHTHTHTCTDVCLYNFYYYYSNPKCGGWLFVFVRENLCNKSRFIFSNQNVYLKGVWG